MDSIKKVVNTAKKLTDLPYNKFNLENYFSVLSEHNLKHQRKHTDITLPIKLMSGGHVNSCIVSSNYDPGHPKKKNIYLIGKGILFDSGGMDLKRGMTDMTGDKAGMIIALSLANYLKSNVSAYCPVTTNFIHTSSIIPGDEIKVGKKVIKITNTDAEGRLILAEALTTLQPSKNDIVITIATLTGAVSYAIGDEATGVFSLNADLIKKYADASANAGELAWALPMWKHYEDKYYKGNEIVNSTKDMKCGATEAALFLKQFVAYPENWIHLDIAGSAFDKAGGANGVPIHSLVNFIKKIK